MKDNNEEVGTSDFPQSSVHDIHHNESLQDIRKRFPIVNREIKTN